VHTHVYAGDSAARHKYDLLRGLGVRPACTSGAGVCYVPACVSAAARTLHIAAALHHPCARGTHGTHPPQQQCVTMHRAVCDDRETPPRAFAATVWRPCDDRVTTRVGIRVATRVGIRVETRVGIVWRPVWVSCHTDPAPSDGHLRVATLRHPSGHPPPPV
jgi:hypothetical protein